MGGNAIKSIELRRLTRAEFEPYMKDVLLKLSTKFSYASPLRYYKNKPSFGDLDIIMNMNDDKGNVREILVELFNTREIYKNDHTYSFEYQEFQVDLIFTTPEHIKTAEFFFAYNDINNLVGRIAHKFNLKFGNEGLHYVVRDHHGSLHKRILISKDERKIYDFLGYSYDNFLQGFDEVEDIFKFVISTKYFNRDIFNYENLNHQNRTRNRKRANYAGFLKYLDDSNNQQFYPFEKDKDVYLNMIDEYFPESNFLKIFVKMRLEFIKQKELNSKFKGEMIMEITNLQGKELGKFIESFKKDKLDFQGYLENSTEEKILKDIKIYYETYLMFKDEENNLIN